MATPIQRRKRRGNGPAVPLGVRVTPEARRLAELGAEALNVTLSRYIEKLIEEDEVARRVAEELDANEEERLTG